MKESNSCKNFLLYIQNFDIQVSHYLPVVSSQIARFGCAYRDEETPVPIPNTEVKLVIADGTAELSVGE